MPEYKLTYFNIRARAELARILFALKGVKYEDIRIEMADWPKIKPSKYTRRHIAVARFGTLLYSVVPGIQNRPNKPDLLLKNRHNQWFSNNILFIKL